MVYIGFGNFGVVHILISVWNRGDNFWKIKDNHIKLSFIDKVIYVDFLMESYFSITRLSFVTKYEISAK